MNPFGTETSTASSTSQLRNASRNVSGGTLGGNGQSKTLELCPLPDTGDADTTAAACPSVPPELTRTAECIVMAMSRASRPPRYVGRRFCLDGLACTILKKNKGHGTSRSPPASVLMVRPRASGTNAPLIELWAPAPVLLELKP